MRTMFLFAALLLPLAWGCAQSDMEAPIEVPPGAQLIKLDLPGMT